MVEPILGRILLCILKCLMAAVSTLLKMTWELSGITIGCEFLTDRPVFISAIRMVKYLFKCFSFFGFGCKMYFKVG